MNQKKIAYPRKLEIPVDDYPKTLPAGGIDYFKKRLDERLEFSAFAAANYSKFLSWQAEDNPFAPIDFLPVSGNISPISRCNFKCTMCAVSDFANGKRCEDMSLDLFIRRLDDLAGLVQVSLVGLSELFLLTHTLEPMLRACKERKIWTHIVTNGSLLHQHNWIERLVEIDVDEVTVSVDGVTKTTFESIRNKSNFERVIANATELNKIFDAMGVTPHRTKMAVVLQSVNFHELFDFVPFAKHLGFKSIAFSIEAFDWGSEVWRYKNSQNVRGITKDDVSKLVEQAKSFDISIGFVDVVQRYVAEPKASSLCSWPFSKIFISSDDRVVPCCHISNPDHFEIGNGLSETFSAKDAWFSDAYIDFRSAHAKGSIPDACSSCYKSKQ